MLSRESDREQCFFEIFQQILTNYSHLCHWKYNNHYLTSLCPLTLNETSNSMYTLPFSQSALAMMKPLTFGFLLLILSALYSCRPNAAEPPLMMQAESVLQSHPDSAYRLLEQIDTASLTPVQRAHHCYLFTAATDKLGLPITWHEEMSQAADLYAPTVNDDETKARIYYYAGLANQRNHKDSAAVSYLYRSLDYQEESVPTRLLVFTYEGIFLSYFNQSYFSEACKFIEKEVDLCRKTNNSFGEVWSLQKYAHTLICLEKYEEAVLILEDCRRAIEKYNYPYWGPYYASCATLYRYKGEYEKALAYNDSALHNFNELNNGFASYYARANIFFKMHNVDSAFVYYMKALKGGDGERNQAIYTSLIELAPLTSLDDHLERSYADSLAHYTELKERMVQPQKIAAIEKAWIQNKMIKTNAKDRSMIYGLIALLLVCGTGLFFYFRQKHQRQLASLHKTNETLLHEQEFNQQEYANTEFLHFRDEIWTPEMTAFMHSDVYDHLIDLLTGDSGDKLPQEVQLSLIADINAAFTNTIIAINPKTEMKISQDELFFLIAFYLDIKPRHIAKCYNCTADSLQKKKQRLKKKLPSLYSSFFFQNAIKLESLKQKRGKK